MLATWTDVGQHSQHSGISSVDLKRLWRESIRVTHLPTYGCSSARAASLPRDLHASRPYSDDPPGGLLRLVVASTTTVFCRVYVQPGNEVACSVELHA